jgi:hypothetical protein
VAKVHFDTKRIEAWCAGNKERMERVMREAVAEAGARIIERTPVDTGFARANWFPTLNGQMAAGGGGAVVATVSFSGARLGDTLGMVNNTEYIRALEYGHSQQAPQGMVRVTARQWPTIVKETAMRVRKNG